MFRQPGHHLAIRGVQLGRFLEIELTPFHHGPSCVINLMDVAQTGNRDDVLVLENATQRQPRQPIVLLGLRRIDERAAFEQRPAAKRLDAERAYIMLFQHVKDTVVLGVVHSYSLGHRSVWKQHNVELRKLSYHHLDPAVIVR